MSCPSLSDTRDAMNEHSMSYITNKHPHLLTLVQQCLESDPVQFLLDCSTMSLVITAHQAEGESVLYVFFKISRLYCHGLYKTRVSLLNEE